MGVSMWVDKDPKSKEVTPLDVPKIVKISCGPQHTVVVDDTNKAYSWGFGGYGRLGHSETGDELVPRLIQALAGKNRGVRDVVCGASRWVCARYQRWSTCGVSTPPPRRRTCILNLLLICQDGIPGVLPVIPRAGWWPLMTH